VIINDIRVLSRNSSGEAQKYVNGDITCVPSEIWTVYLLFVLPGALLCIA
jgi:hypothetical protein